MRPPAHLHVLVVLGLEPLPGAHHPLQRRQPPLLLRHLAVKVGDGDLEPLLAVKVGRGAGDELGVAGGVGLLGGGCERLFGLVVWVGWLVSAGPMSVVSRVIM
jgi:hypothetical protein